MNFANIRPAVEALRAVDFVWNPTKKTHEETQRPPHVFERDGQLFVSAEDGGYFADYYGSSGMWIKPELEAVAKAHGGYWEWVNPGCISFCQ